MKVAKTTKPTQKKVSFLLLKPYFRSNTEFSEEERDDGDMETTYPSSHFHKRNKHFGSDDSDGERASLLQIKKVDDDDEENLVESSLHAMRVSEGLYKALDELSVNPVEQLITFYVSSRHQEERGILFYKSSPNEPNYEDLLMIKMIGDEEPWPLRIPDYYPPQLRKLVKQVGIGGKHSKGRHFPFERLWHPFKSVM